MTRTGYASSPGEKWETKKYRYGATRVGAPLLHERPGIRL
jgi:hypothetical protein